jgi:hypothetical protein
MYKQIVLALCLTAVPCSAGMLVGCSSEEKVEVATPEDAIVEEHEGGSVAFSVAGDGKVRAAVSGPDGKPIKEKVSGTLAWKADAAAEPKTVPLDLDAKAGVLVAAGPKLEADITQVGYTVTVDGKPWSGTLHLPAGGTAELVASAKAGAEASASLDGKVGPHGGVIQIVGEDRFEIVADEVSGEVRVYLLDADLNIVAMGDRKITLAVVGDASQVIVLEPDLDGGLYLKGKWNLQADPIKITLAVRANAGAKVNVAIVGFRPNMKFALHAKGPRVKVRLKSAFDGDVDVKARAKLGLKAKVKAPDVNVKAKADAKIKAPDVDVKAKVKAPEVNVKKKADAKASAGAGAGAKAGAKAGAGASVGLKIN